MLSGTLILKGALRDLSKGAEGNWFSRTMILLYLLYYWKQRMEQTNKNTINIVAGSQNTTNILENGMLL